MCLVPHVELGREQHVPDSSKHSLLMKNTKKQPLDGSICLSPEETEFNEQFARQCRFKPPPEFSLTGKVQHHSSPYTDALTENSQDHGWLKGWS